jgi:hypothetical protein
VNDRDAASQFSQSLFKLFSIIVGRSLLDLAAQFVTARFDIGLLPASAHNGRIIFIYHDTLGAAELLEFDLVEFQTELFRNHLAASQNCHVLQDGLAAVAETSSIILP